MKFGQYSILDPVEHHFEKDPDKIWIIKPPTSGDELALEKFLIQKRLVVAEGQQVSLPPTNLEVAHREIALTFGGTTLVDTEIPNNTHPILDKNASVAEIEAVLCQMPYDLVMELWSAVGEATLAWGPQKNSKN